MGAITYVICLATPSLPRKRQSSSPTANVCECPMQDDWIQSEIEQAMRELDGPDAELVDNEDVEAEWRQRRAELIGRLAASFQ